MAKHNQTHPTTRRSLPWRATIAGLMAVAAISSTGCQMNVGGQTLPSPYYIDDDVQYFQSGPEFKLAREAAAMKAYSANEDDR